jgi:magnesium chelatase subunit I
MEKKDLPDTSSTFDPSPKPAAGVRSLRELIDLVTGKSYQPSPIQEESALAEKLPFPFLGIVGQEEMKIALLLTVINPLVGGVLLVGPRGTGKTTAVRSLVNLMPMVERSTCFYGCVPEDIEAGGIEAVCPDCARKYGEGQPLTRPGPVRLVELPLNTQLADLIGRLDEKTPAHERMRLHRGLLSLADQNVLYVDEVNLLTNELVDAILDASAQGTYTVRNSSFSSTYRARFSLVGSMNPEEGNLRPQIMDRFGLRVIVQGLETPNERIEAYDRVRSYLRNPHVAVQSFAYESDLARKEIQSAREILPRVNIPGDVTLAGITMIQRLKIDSLRADITLFEAARAYCASDARIDVSLTDLKTVAPMALRLRRSPFMVEYFKKQAEEELELKTIIQEVID